MNRDAAQQFTGWMFILSAAMIWTGWMLLPVRVGAFFQPADFSVVREHLAQWIWMYRIHLFGTVIAVVSLIAFGTLFTGSAVRYLLWPGIAVTVIGLAVTTLAGAFYYNFGVRGAVALEGKTGEAAMEYVASLQVVSDYVGCFVRFGRVFSGLGLVLVGTGIMKSRALSRWIGVSAVAIGAAAMALTMIFPDEPLRYTPIFHVSAAWLLFVGIMVFVSGVSLRD